MKVSAKVIHSGIGRDEMLNFASECISSSRSGRDLVGLTLDKSYLSLERVIEENPNLSGPEAIILYDLEKQTAKLKYQNYLQEKLKELYSRQEQTFLIKKYNDTKVYVKVLEYYIENNNLYVKVNSLEKSSNSVIFRENDNYDVNYLFDNVANVISPIDPVFYNNMENSYINLQRNLNR